MFILTLISNYLSHEKPLGALKVKVEFELPLPHFKKYRYVKKNLKGFFFYGRFLLELYRNPPLIWLETSPGPIRSFIVKENHFGSVVSQIFTADKNSLKFFIIGSLCFHSEILHKEASTFTINSLVSQIIVLKL